MDDQQNVQDVTAADDGRLQEQGAIGGEPAQFPTAVGQSLDLSSFLLSSRGRGEEGGLDRELERARRDADRFRNEREEARRALDDARHRQERQDAQMDFIMNELRELRRECFREVRESPTRDFGLDNRGGTRLRTAEQSEVSGRLAPPSGGPVASTPSRVVDFNLDDRPSPAPIDAVGGSQSRPEH